MTLATPQIVPWPIGARGKLPVRRRRPRSARGRLKNWSGKRDLNPRPQPWQGCALPLSYSRPMPSNLSKRPRGRSTRGPVGAILQDPLLGVSEKAGRLLRGGRVDEEAGTPLEAGHAGELRHQLEVPVERLALGGAERGRVKYEVVGRVAEHVLEAGHQLPQEPRERLDPLRLGALEGRLVSRGQNPRLERDAGREGRHGYEPLLGEHQPGSVPPLLAHDVAPRAALLQ